MGRAQSVTVLVIDPLMSRSLGTLLLAICIVAWADVGFCQQAKPSLLYEGLVASRARMMGGTPSPGNHQIMMRSAHIASEDLNNIRIVFSNFYNASKNGGNPISDSGRGGASSITASVEYPAGTFAQVKFGGSATGLIPDANVLFSDYLTVSIPSGAIFWVRLFTNNPAGIIFNPWQNTFLGEAIDVAASGLTDQTTGGTIKNKIGWSTPPLAILGMTKNASAIIVGDSIAAGQGDIEDSSKTAAGFDGKVGVIARALGNVPFLNLAVSGENAYTWSSDATARNLVIQKGSHLISELGLSDVINRGRTVSQTIAALQSVYALARPSQKIYQTTWTPHSSSSDSWATTDNQKALDNDAIKRFNTAARSRLPGTQGTFDIARVFDSSPDSGLWTVTPMPPYTADGVHPKPSGYLLVPSTGVIGPVVWP
jgi:lysophospholipase L1-like esterase